MANDPRTLLEDAGNPVTDADSGWVPVGDYPPPISIHVTGLGAGDGVTIYKTNVPDPTDSHTGQEVAAEKSDADFFQKIDDRPQYIRVEGTSDGGNASTISAYLSAFRPGT